MSATSASVVRDRRAERRAATRAEILDAAWELVRAEGLAALTMRTLGARVGMRAQSLYAYFPAKNAIYDAMFAGSNRLLLERLGGLPPLGDPVDGLRRRARLWLGFCVEDPVRYQLLFQRTIPGFEPSPRSYALAVQAFEDGRRALADCGITSGRALDTYTGLVAGLAAQQNSNEPGGDRWVRLLEEFMDMFLTRYPPAQGRRQR
jgi:AcrR family transcriptional regulator